ncbi:Fe-S cluster assembly scaffold SufA [Veronia nyctiphanis]|uniref:Fe-S cluster assembly scaffold SufA n=1 Tax=Veronia nyctiphanis TaxID=1278244 RepID=A0A4Q0YLS1_9GAMM|nr:iron-sulfur cluster assembly accessory protein [Veronia nyctiphanis]RXJ71757.1 Fe-S cluster assembly scaffold SufA [Veronia nyctiphanis]
MADQTGLESFDPNAANWKGLTLTDKAAKRIKKLIDDDNQIIGLRLNVKPSGCAGFAYALSFAKDEPIKGDLEFIYQGASIFVPEKAMPYLDGTEVDFISEGLNQMFKYNNPNVENACGCGESFNVHDD